MKKILLSVLFFAFSSSLNAADIYIGVESISNAPKQALAFNLFKAEDSSSTTLKNIALFNDIVRNDLYLSRYFNIQESTDTQSVQDNAALEYWGKSANYMVGGSFNGANNSFVFSGTVYDLQTKKPVMIKNYRGTETQLRISAHAFANAVIEKIAGFKGIAHSKIAFINDSTGYKEVYVADYDGENVKRITNDRNINLLPRWNTDSSNLYYTTYRHGNPDLFEVDFKNGKIKPFSTYLGLNIPGGISPDGSTMVLTASKGKDPMIYLLDMKTRKSKPLLSTKYGITASPTWSPDGKEIAFVSDRSGNPQIHVYNTETKEIRKLTKMNWCDSPAWSPDGRFIAFSGRETYKERFNIFIADITGKNIIRLTVKAGNNENPSWSPDGRFIAFTSTRSGKKELFVMDADGSAPHAISKIKGNSFTPMWSK